MVNTPARKLRIKFTPAKVAKTPHPAVTATAEALARGKDVHLTTQPDGSIVIKNGARHGTR